MYFLRDMDEDSTQYLSQDKQAALKKELVELRSVKIPQIAKRIDEARQMGDLSENAEYHAAREEMGWAQARAKELEYILDNAKVISQVVGKKQDTVGMGGTIIVSSNGKRKEFTIVGAQEADPSSGRISNESPLGQAFLGKKKGNHVEVRAPSGVQIYEILDIK